MIEYLHPTGLRGQAALGCGANDEHHTTVRIHVVGPVLGVVFEDEDGRAVSRLEVLCAP